MLSHITRPEEREQADVENIVRKILLGAWCVTGSLSQFRHLEVKTFFRWNLSFKDNIMLLQNTLPAHPTIEYDIVIMCCPGERSRCTPQCK